MNWFRKSSHAQHASPRSSRREERHKRIKKTKKEPAATDSEDDEQQTPIGVAVDMSKSLGALERIDIELQDPEVFFHDPEHVRNYKEEAKFLSLMSEWEIVPHPDRALEGNFFSADFEEQFLQLRTQDAPLESLAAQQSESLADSCMAAEIDEERPVASMSDCSFTAGGELQLQWEAELTASSKQQDALQTLPYRRRLCELLFADSIQTGIALPTTMTTTTTTTMTKRVSVSRRAKKRKAHAISTSCDSDGSNANSIDTDSSEADGALAILTGTERTCVKRVNKDCAINRRQLKTEALACSIMGAIGKCPAKDSTPLTSISDLIYQTGDACHPTSWSGCDHYDIKLFFRLDDNGNILLNVSHIREYKGFGFAVAQNKRLYRRYLKQVHMACESYAKRRTWLECIKRLLQLLWNILLGHPRNKINPYGAGPGDTVRAYTLQLAQDQSSTFARNIENFISCTKESREAAPQVVMRNMRQFMNGMKNYLVKHGEGKFHQEVETARARLKSDEFLNLDAILETVMHQLIVLPLREHLYGMFVDYYTRSEDIQLLAQNVKYACARSAADFGIRPTVTPPSTESLHVISNLLLRLQEAELPLDKLDIFLCVISTIFDATGCPRGQQLGADDFLPVLVYVVAKCGFVGAEIEAEFMWGLLQPTLLNGEPGYYLTALCSAVHVLKSFMASENESGTGSLDWRSSSLPACSSVLRVIIPDECNGSLQTRTLPVRPHTTTREVCRIIAHKARITNPQDYALFKLVDGEETLLNETECPQDIRLAAKGKHCMLAYKRIDAKIAWPTVSAAQPIFN